MHIIVAVEKDINPFKFGFSNLSWKKFQKDLELGKLLTEGTIKFLQEKLFQTQD